jgi:haloalkane dehalogenase
MHSARIDGLDIAYRELGEGPAVLLLHGWPTSSYLFKDSMPAIARHHRAIAPDLPGFGASSKPDVRYDFPLFEGVIDGLLDDLGVDEVAIVGHDLGGPIGVHWALRNPDRVTAIALLNTLLYPEFTPEIIEFVEMMLDPQKAYEATSPESLAAFIRSGLSEGFAAADEVIAEFQAPYASDAARKTLAAASIGLSLEGFREVAAGLPSITVPVRAIYGEQDRVLPDVADTMRKVKRDIPHAEISSLPSCGHFLTGEEPRLVGALLGEFLDAVPERQAAESSA